jgi:excisionase family DNA binding protein
MSEEAKEIGRGLGIGWWEGSVVISHPALDRLVARETFAEMLEVFRPFDLVIAILRMEGLTGAEIGEVLDLDPSAVWRRVEQVKARVMEEVPELRSELRGRRWRRQRDAQGEVPPLERGWIRRWLVDGCGVWTELKPDLTTAQVARHYGVSPSTVRRWIQAGRFPHAYQLDNRRKEYRVPEVDLED